MYRSSSPVFDLPEFPPPVPFRRLKPLPKRRRTSGSDLLPRPTAAQALPLATSPSMPTPLRVPSPAAPMPDLLGGVDSIAEELVAHPGSVTSQLALQSYYTTILRHGSNDNSTRGASLAGEAQSVEDDPARSTTSHPFDLSAVYRRLAETMTTSAAGSVSSVRPQVHGARQDDDLSEGDSTDHMQQHGNTKKRKVPANVARAAGWRERSLSLGAVDEMGIAGQAEHDLDILAAPSLSPSVAQTLKKGKISPSALAGLQHKELLKQRKRQLAAVLGALSLGDTVALDQALSTHIPFVSMTSDPDADADMRKVRLSRRRGPRLARAARAQMAASSSPNVDKRTRVLFPTTQFAFAYPSATSDRLLTTKEEMLALRKRFETELACQAAKAAKAAAEAKQAALAAGKTSQPKRSGKAQPRKRTAVGSGDTPTEPTNSPPLPKTRGTKKKKNVNVASDPHDRKNYTPSRLSVPIPSNPAHTKQISPGSERPLLFLSADIPPRKRKKATATPTTQIVDPAEEWICPYCEYSLFYTDGPEYKRAVRNRKQILRRRRRAQERAAGGLSAPKTPAKATSDNDDDDDQFTTQSPTISKSTEWKQGPDIKGLNGQHHLQSG
ncbi:hypothetical protein J3A83DRAFT_4360397 [Scleroderma citrinum]